MEKNQDLQLVFVTTDNYENASMIARNIISEQLAACCTIISNATSFYYWEDKLTESNEYLIIIKTTLYKLNELETRILQLHKYKVPEIIAVPVSYGSEKYLNWVKTLLTNNNTNI